MLSSDNHWSSTYRNSPTESDKLTSTAFYQTFVGQITSPVCPHRGSGEVDSWTFTPVMSKMGSGMSASFWWIHRHCRCALTCWSFSSQQGTCVSSHTGTVPRARRDNNKLLLWVANHTTQYCQTLHWILAWVKSEQVLVRFIKLNKHKMSQPTTY